MYKQSIQGGRHKWDKQNLVGQRTKAGIADTYKCTHCGMIGKVLQLGTIEISENYKIENVKNCPKALSISRVKVTRCTAYGKVFSNLLPDTEHDVVEPPKPYKNDGTGVWVMGVGEPVKLMNNEFVRLN